MRKQRARDDRDFDTSALKARADGKVLSRDYSAHFFRWSFARRMLTRDDDVLEVGCGVEKPLANLLLRGPPNELRCRRYVGVDLNPLEPWGNGKAEFIGEFDFTKRWRELEERGPFSAVVHLEVIEHMRVEHGRNLLKGCSALLVHGGRMLMSTPVYDGKRHAANHVHEYTVPELKRLVERAGFEVERRFGTSMDLRHIGRAEPSEETKRHGLVAAHVLSVGDALSEYFDRHAISNIFGPLYPDLARNNLWVCRKL